MSEATVESGTTNAAATTGGNQGTNSTPPPAGGQTTTNTGTAETFTRDYVEGLRKEAGDYRTAAKTAQQELDRIKASQMSDTERAIEEAKKAARQETAADFGKRLAGAEFRAAAREKGVDVKDVLDWVDLNKFVDDKGEVDSKAVEQAVGRFAAIKQPNTGNFDGGARANAPKPQRMDDFIRRQVGATADE